MVKWPVINLYILARIYIQWPFNDSYKIHFVQIFTALHTHLIYISVCVCVCLIHTERGTFEQIDNENQKPHKIKIVTSFIPESL